MRKALHLIITTLLLGVVATILPVLAAGTNLIANESVESPSSVAAPLNWHADKWGSNTADLQYVTNGHTGSRSLYVSMSAHTTGDAKWMHDAVTVKPGTSYTYTSAYKSNIDTEIDLQYIDTAGNVTYAYVGQIAPSTEWGEASVDFITPANAAKVTVMHIVAQPGWLQTDDFALSETVTAPVVDQDNYVHNGSFEDAKNGTPAAWYKNSWGTNSATFSHDTTGRTGTRSATVTVSAYTNGDAKWYAEPATVTPSKSYLYRDYYKSNVPTRVVVAFIDAANNYTYQELTGAPASNTDWSPYSATFTAPASAVKASVYHIIDSVGYLTLDDVSLYVALPTPTEPTIPNASFETAAGAMPAQWQQAKWGTNTATYQYVNEGHTGTKSAKVTVSNYVDGDAKWLFNPITTATPGKQYRATIWYKTNIAPHAVAMFIMADGTEQYYGMPIPQPAANSATTWQKYSDTFSVPVGAVSTSVFLYVNQNGWVQTDDYSLTSYHPDGFTQPLLTMTFDDGHEDNAKTALPILNQYGLKTTQCFATSFIEGQSQAVIDEVLAFENSGHEICSHTVTHPFLTTVAKTKLTYELQHSQQYLESLIGKPVPNFASPYGDYDATVNTEIKKYYRSHRSVDEGYNSKDNFNIYSLRVQNILDTTSAQQVAAWIAQAQADRTWLILVYHRVANDPGPYDSSVGTFTEHVKAIKDSGITVKTFNSALDEVTAQLP